MQPQVWLDAFDAWDHERKRLCEATGESVESVGFKTQVDSSPLCPELTGTDSQIA